MDTTMELLAKALKHTDSGTFWAEQLQMSRSALAVSKMRGRLSPTIAGNLARLLGEDECFWTAVAALEAEKPSYGRSKLMGQRDEWRKRTTRRKSED